MNSKPKRGRPPKSETAEKKTVEIPFDEVRKWVTDTPSLTASEILDRLGWRKEQKNLTKLGKFLKKIKGSEFKASENPPLVTPKPVSSQTQTGNNWNTSVPLGVSIDPTKLGQTQVSTTSTDGNMTLSLTSNPPQADVETILDGVKTQIYTAQVEGIAKKIILNPRLYMWYTFLAGKGFDGDIADMINDCVEDFLASRG